MASVGLEPACAQVCPTDAITYGDRDAMVAEAEERIASMPGRYVPHVYGKDEVGGTSVLHLSAVPFEKIGYETGLPMEPMPNLTHKVLRFVPSIFFSLLAVFGVLAWTTRRCMPRLGLLEDDQPIPRCNCGFEGDAESFASLTGIRQNLLPYWLSRNPDHPLHELEIADAAKRVRSYGEDGDEMALAIFEQQAAAIGRLFTIMANVTDPDVYFIGGGVLEAADHFREAEPE